MKKMMLLFCVLTVIGLSVKGVQGAIGKCTVVKVDGVQMVIECNKDTRGFSKGNPIKIKSDKQNTVRKK
jgi:hypothetical protein